MSSTIETLERELEEAQLEREERQRSVTRAENAHEAACAARDEAWTQSASTDPEVERLTSLVYERRRKMYEAIDELKAAEGKERRTKSRLMYVLPAERRRYLSGGVDEEFDLLLKEIQRAYSDELAGVEISVVSEGPGELDLRGDATWKALERLYSGTTRMWIEIHATQDSDLLGIMARHVSHLAGGHVPRVFAGDAELDIKRVHTHRPHEEEERRSPGGFEGREGRMALARITARRYLDEGSVERLEKHSESLEQIAGLARLYQSMSLTVDEIRWRLEQLISLRPEMLQAIHQLTGERRRFSFYDIARAARLLDGHFPDAGVSAEALTHASERALESRVPLVDIAYMGVTSGEWR